MKIRKKMKSKKNLEKEFHNMRLLLRESILTSNPQILIIICKYQIKNKIILKNNNKNNN